MIVRVDIVAISGQVDASALTLTFRFYYEYRRLPFFVRAHSNAYLLLLSWSLCWLLWLVVECSLTTCIVQAAQLPLFEVAFPRSSHLGAVPVPLG